MKRFNLMSATVVLVSLVAGNVFGEVRYNVTDLGTLGGTASWAYAINNSGQVVGLSQAVWPDNRAFLYSNGTMTDLNTLIDSTSAWTLRGANAINDSGWIVGYGTNPAGQEHAFLLTPTPEPSTFVLIGIAVVSRLGYPRRRRQAA